MIWAQRWFWLSVSVVLPACQRGEPPGVGARSSAAGAASAGAAASTNAASPPARSGAEPGTIADNLPFAETGQKLLSIAWRTWIYTDTGPTRTRFGYLRAGSIVERREPPIVNDGCSGGWYRINPRGFVCVGKGATLDLNHPIAKLASVRPTRGQALPYVYAMADDDAPHLYFRLPSAAELRRVEGENALGRALDWRGRMQAQGLFSVIGEPEETPDFLREQKPVDKPYGVASRLHYSVHAGRATPNSGFALARVFDWDKRVYGFSTEHDIIALDRTRVVRPSAFHGVELGEGEALPVAFVDEYSVVRYTLENDRQFRASGSYARRQGIALTGEHRGQGAGAFWQTRDGSWVVLSGLRLLSPRASYPSFATGDRKWIDISIQQQSLVAYSGRKPVYATLVSSGRGGMGDPEKTDATVRGTFMIYQKDVSSTMDGAEDRSDGYALQDVPFVQYFHKGYALHGAYWHDEFGKIRSHGCVNLAPRDAAWLFEWTDPAVPAEWHGVINKERGTVVFIHP